MANRLEQLDRILGCGIVAVVRSPDPAPLIDAFFALAEGGVTVAEVTLTVPRALEVLEKTRAAIGKKMVIGAGTILDAESARSAILAGAEFIVSPTLNLDGIAMAHRYDIPVMPGAFSPTEILTAWEHGADIIKVFPADVLGPVFFKAMRGPLPQIRMMPTGGVDTQTALPFLQAGACALGIGSQLIEPTALEKRDFTRITELAKQYRQIVMNFRQGSTNSPKAL